MFYILKRKKEKKLMAFLISNIRTSVTHLSFRSFGEPELNSQ